LLFVLLFFGPGENVTILLRADFGESSSNVTHTPPRGTPGLHRLAGIGDAGSVGRTGWRFSWSGRCR